MEEIKIQNLPPSVDCESVAILKQLNKASRALGQLKGEVSKIPNSQILLDTLTLQEVVYTPPQLYADIKNLLDNLERYINIPEFHETDALIKMPIIHFQFESIHPYFDGNGRTGRLLNILYLVQQGLLDIPVLYLSSYIIKNKSDYYRLLQDVRTKGSWEEWIVWMLKGVERTAKETIVVVNKIKVLMDDYKKEIRSNVSFYSHDLINIFFKHPYTKNNFLERELKIHRKTASNYLNTLADAGLLTKVKIWKHNYFINAPLLKVLKER